MICYVRDFVHIFLHYSGSSGGCLSLRHNFAAADAAHLDSQWDIATCVLQASGDQIEIVLYVDNRRLTNVFECLKMIHRAPDYV